MKQKNKRSIKFRLLIKVIDRVWAVIILLSLIVIVGFIAFDIRTNYLRNIYTDAMTQNACNKLGFPEKTSFCQNHYNDNNTLRDAFNQVYNPQSSNHNTFEFLWDNPHNSLFYLCENVETLDDECPINRCTGSYECRVTIDEYIMISIEFDQNGNVLSYSTGRIDYGQRPRDTN